MATRSLRPRLAWLEALGVFVASLVLVSKNDAAALTDVSHTVPGNLGDPLYFAWQMAWVGHAVTSDPASLWTTNAFAGMPDNLAFTDTILGYLPISLVTQAGAGGQAGALAALNIAGFVANVLAVCGGYALARAMGAGLSGAALAGIGFGLAPWRVEQAIHLNVVSTGGIALTLALLSHAHGWSLRHGFRWDRLSPWAAGGAWAVACWQLTLGFATGIVFAYALAITGLLLICGWFREGCPRLPRALVVADAAGAAAFLLVTFLLTRPYLRVVEQHPAARRSEAMLDLFSPPPRGLKLSSATSWYWGDRQMIERSRLPWPPEMIISPGVVLAVLAVLGLVVSAWPLRRRLVLGGVTAVVTVLALGTQAWDHGEMTYLPLYHHLPGWEDLRTPGRLVIWTTIGLALLAAGFLTRVADVLLGRSDVVGEVVDDDPAIVRVRSFAAGLVGLVVVSAPIALVAADDWGGPLHWPVATAPVDVRALPTPILFLPTDSVADYHLMLWSTEGWPLLANGSSGFDPPSQTTLRQVAKSFPDAASVAALRARGVRSVVLVRSRAPGTPWESAADRPVAGLPVIRRDTGDAVVYELPS